MLNPKSQEIKSCVVAIEHRQKKKTQIEESLLVVESKKKEREMASFTASASTISVARPALLLKPTLAVSAPVLGLPPMGKRKGGVRCSMETKQGNGSVVGAGVSAAATAALTAVMSSPAMALVDDRMSTEGTGLPFGLSNNLLGWILFGVFGLIWTFYFVYTSSLEEDEESGLSL